MLSLEEQTACRGGSVGRGRGGSVGDGPSFGCQSIKEGDGWNKKWFGNVIVVAEALMNKEPPP